MGHKILVVRPTRCLPSEFTDNTVDEPNMFDKYIYLLVMKCFSTIKCFTRYFMYLYN